MRLDITKHWNCSSNLIQNVQFTIEMDEIRFVLGHLNDEPFNRKLNIISYDNLRPEQRIEILMQIIKHIDPMVTNLIYFTLRQTILIFFYLLTS